MRILSFSWCSNIQFCGLSQPQYSESLHLTHLKKTALLITTTAVQMYHRYAMVWAIPLSLKQKIPPLPSSRLLCNSSFNIWSLYVQMACKALQKNSCLLWWLQWQAHVCWQHWYITVETSGLCSTRTYMCVCVCACARVLVCLCADESGNDVPCLWQAVCPIIISARKLRSQ